MFQDGNPFNPQKLDNTCRNAVRHEKNGTHVLSIRMYSKKVMAPSSAKMWSEEVCLQHDCKLEACFALLPETIKYVACFMHFGSQNFFRPHAGFAFDDPEVHETYRNMHGDKQKHVFLTC